MFREAAFGGQYVQEAMNSTVHHGTCGRALSSLGTIVVPNGQQRWFLTPSEESAASDTRSSLLWALRARHCYLTFSVTVATAILNVAILKKCWQSTWLTKLLCRKSALRTRHCYSESAWEWRIFHSQVKRSRYFTPVVPEMHVGHSNRRHPKSENDSVAITVSVTDADPDRRWRVSVTVAADAAAGCCCYCGCAFAVAVAVTDTFRMGGGSRKL